MTTGIAIHFAWTVLPPMVLWFLVQGRNALPPPTSLHAELMSVNQVQITWDPPAKDNNITYYRLHYNSSSLPDADAYIFLNSLYTGYQLTNLLPNTTCNIDLSWTNGRGESAKTEVIQITTPLFDLPAPKNLQANLMSASQVQITWDPVDTEHNVSYYKLHYNSSSLPGQDAYIFLDPIYTDYQLTNLLPNMTCSIDLSWTNGRGESAKTDIIQITTPLYVADTDSKGKTKGETKGNNICMEALIFYCIACACVFLLLIIVCGDGVLYTKPFIHCGSNNTPNRS